MTLSPFAWMRNRRHRRRLDALAYERRCTVRRRNDVLHEIIAIRRAAEHEMRRMGGDVIEGRAIEE